MKRAFLCFILLACVHSTNAQEREYTVQEVKIVENRLYRDQISADSLAFRNSMLLMNSMPGIVWRANGGAGSSGISIQGAAASHTEVIWNGIPFNNSFLSQADGSLLSEQMLRHSGIRRGGRSENGFCSSFGGSLILGSLENSEENGIEIGSSAGSFAQLQQWAGWTGKTKSVNGHLRIWNQSGLWNYPFNHDGFITELRHSARTFSGIEGTGKLKISKDHAIESGLWIQKSTREIPAVLFEGNPGGNQGDENSRAFIRHTYSQNWGELHHSLGMSHDILHYSELKKRTDNRAEMLGLYYRAGASGKFRNLLLNLNAHFSSQTGIQSTYPKNVIQNRMGTSLSSSIPFFQNRLLLKPEVRVEIWHIDQISRTDQGLLPSIAILWNCRNYHNFEISIHRKMRSPGLNDLFWPEAGNPNLKAETGYNAQADWKWQVNTGTWLKYRQHSGIYLTRISSYILWLPVDLWWRPQNAGNAMLRGIFIKPGMDFHTQTGIRATLETELRFSSQHLLDNPSDQNKRLNLPLSPEFQSSVFASAGKGKMDGFFRFTHTGARPTGLRTSQYLDAYFLLDAGIDVQIPLQQTTMKLSAQAGNLLNTSYRLVPAWPMPGRNFSLGISIKL